MSDGNGEQPDQGLMGNGEPKSRWRRPAPEIVQLVRSLAIDDAFRDHDAAMADLRRRSEEHQGTGEGGGADGL
jgi:hypothetical protein